MHLATVQGCTSWGTSETEHKRGRQKKSERDEGIVEFDNNAIMGSTSSTLRQSETTLQK